MFEFKRKERLRLQSEFEEIYQRSKRFSNECFSLYVVKKETSSRKIAFVVKRNTIRKATARNRVKRLLREAYRLNKNKLIEGINLLLKVKDERIVELNFLEVEKKLLHLFSRAGILKDETNISVDDKILSNVLFSDASTKL
jgi:ribonuclease P protein component